MKKIFQLKATEILKKIEENDLKKEEVYHHFK